MGLSVGPVVTLTMVGPQTVNRIYLDFRCGPSGSFSNVGEYVNKTQFAPVLAHVHLVHLLGTLRRVLRVWDSESVLWAI